MVFVGEHHDKSGAKQYDQRVYHSLSNHDHRFFNYGLAVFTSTDGSLFRRDILKNAFFWNDTYFLHDYTVYILFVFQ